MINNSHKECSGINSYHAGSHRTLPEDPEELRSLSAPLLEVIKAQAIRIAKLRRQLAGHRVHGIGASSGTAEQLQLALETSEIATASKTARRGEG